MAKELTLSMSLDEANVVLNALAAQPYGQVAQLIAKLSQQAQAKLQDDAAGAADEQA